MPGSALPPALRGADGRLGSASADSALLPSPTGPGTPSRSGPGASSAGAPRWPPSPPGPALARTGRGRAGHGDRHTAGPSALPVPLPTRRNPPEPRWCPGKEAPRLPQPRCPGGPLVCPPRQETGGAAAESAALIPPVPHRTSCPGGDKGAALPRGHRCSGVTTTLGSPSFWEQGDPGDTIPGSPLIRGHCCARVTIILGTS